MAKIILNDYEETIPKALQGKIRRKAKKFGGEASMNFSHCAVSFGHIYMDFLFYPFRYEINIVRCYGNSYTHNTSHFITRDDANAVKKDMDLALEFVEFMEKLYAEFQKKRYTYYVYSPNKPRAEESIVAVSVTEADRLMQSKFGYYGASYAHKFELIEDN